MGGRGGGGSNGAKDRAANKAKANAAINKGLVRSYVNGKSISTIAAETGRSPSQVHQRLVSSGVQLRPRGGARRRRT